jgi:carotenoid cleavage dioxygenase
MSPSLDPYLSKGYAPLRSESVQAELDIEGVLPDGLNGSFYRIGPSPQFPPRGRYNPLNGDGMVHAFRIERGRVSYRNRWVRTERWRLEREAGRVLFGTSGLPGDDDPSVSGTRTDGVANTNVVRHAHRFLALEEGHAPYALDPVSLDTIGRFTFDGRLPRNMTAHPKIDTVSGAMIFIANFENLRAPKDVGLHVVDASGALARSEIVAGPFPALIHDFALTEDFVILPFCPVTVSMRRAMAGGPLIAWEPMLGTRVGVLSRTNGTLRWFEGPAVMAWHVMNAFNMRDRIVVDVCPQDAPMFPLADGALPDETKAAQRLTRWEFDWAKPGAFESHRLGEQATEYPRVDERYAGRSYRTGYVASIGGPGTGDIFHRGLACYDHERATWTFWNAGPHAAVAEPVFAPARADACEGEGFLLTNVYDETRKTSHLAILDAQDLARGPVARAHLTHHVPVGFHGCWMPAD